VVSRESADRYGVAAIRVSGNEADTSAGIVSLGMLGAIFASESGRRILLMFPDHAAGMPAKGGFACTTLPPGCPPCVGEGEADSTQTAVMRPCIRACFASVALPSSHRADAHVFVSRDLCTSPRPEGDVDVFVVFLA